MTYDGSRTGTRQQGRTPLPSAARELAPIAQTEALFPAQHQPHLLIIRIRIRIHTLFMSSSNIHILASP